MFRVFFFKGEKVRGLKAGGGEKEKVDEEVQLLLKLKQALALAKGEPLEVSNKKKKGKKK